MTEGYAPGWTPDVLAMMRRRRASTRAAFVEPFLRDGVRVLDVGCGPGTITAGLAAAVAPHGFALGVDLWREQFTPGLTAVQGSVYAVPVRTGTVDVVFANALADHLRDLPSALAELRRVLRPGGVLAIASADWRGAVLDPRTADVDLALSGHHTLRRRVGGDPFAGGALPVAVAAAGFTDVTAEHVDLPDMTYRELAEYVAVRLAEAGLHAEHAAARRWARDDGVFTQRWVQVVARAGTGPGGGALQRTACGS
jgi:SAM-dependent methyltransferase